MSLLSNFVASHLIPALESAFVAHEPDMQAAFLEEAKILSEQLGKWLESKVIPTSEEHR